ncbi:MAG: hypothetical protein WBW73_14685 [Rhodoplanes sp.]
MTQPIAAAMLTDELATWLAAVVERQDHKTAKQLATHIRAGRKFTFNSLAMLLDADADDLIQEFEAEAARHGKIIAAKYQQ